MKTVEVVVKIPKFVYDMTKAQKKVIDADIEIVGKAISEGTVLPKGYWIDEADREYAHFGRHTYKCSECDKYAEYFVSGTENWWDSEKPNYCPNCGAKMEDKE